MPENPENPVVYLCAEFAIDSDLPTYSGGLGILAADVISSAGDTNFPMIGIGILYKGKNYIQHITGVGSEEKRDSEFDHDTSFLRPTFLNGQPLILNLQLENTKVLIKVYQIRIGEKTTLYFLSTDVDGNPPEWVSDMDALYAGDTNSQIRQQIILGLGGIKLLEALDINPSVYHLNEGRPGLIIWELTKNLMKKDNMQFKDAWDKAKKQIVYTNHTLVAAGNLNYPYEVIERYATPVAREMGVDTNLLIKDGLTDTGNFSITLFALNISKKCSSVSKLHNSFCQKEWPNYKWLNITNGVHMGRWQDSDFRKSLNDRQLWDLHMTKKRELQEVVIKRTGFGYDPSRLVISWARRLAEYKQPKSIFQDLDRLKAIVENSEKPVQILFAGNSHSADPGAKNLIEEVINIMATRLSGHAIFIPNYNISLANRLVSGSDVWLNTPKGNLEASGTSGMKAIANGLLNCTVIDGWTAEVNWEGIGWTLDPSDISNYFYEKLENEIIPMYYDRDQNGLPAKWIERMKKSIELSKNFSTERVLMEYQKLLYS
jgi:glucan phosphorylase